MAPASVGNLCAQILMSTFCSFATKLVASLPSSTARHHCSLLSTAAAEENSSVQCLVAWKSVLKRAHIAGAADDDNCSLHTRRVDGRVDIQKHESESSSVPLTSEQWAVGCVVRRPLTMPALVRFRGNNGPVDKQEHRKASSFNSGMWCASFRCC